MKLHSHKAESERAIDSLLAAAQSDRLRPACDFLLFNSDDLAGGGSRENLLLVDVANEHLLEDALDYLSAQVQVAGAQAFRDVMTRFQKPLNSILVDIGKSMESENPSEQEAFAISQRVFVENRKTLEPVFTQAFLKHFGVIGDGGGLAIAKFASGLRLRQIASTLGIVDYPAMVDALQEIRAAVPRIRVLLCPTCRNVEVTMARISRTLSQCTWCQAPAPCLSLLFVSRDLQALKLKNNSDMSVFMSAYLRLQSYLHVGIFPCAEFASPAHTEVDVFLEGFPTCIEIKLFNGPGSFNPQKLANEIGKIAAQIKKQSKLGLNYFIVATNLREWDGEEFVRRLGEKVGSSIKLESLTPPFSQIINRLKGIGEDLVKHAEENWGKSLHARMKKATGNGRGPRSASQARTVAKNAKSSRSNRQKKERIRNSTPKRKPNKK